MNAHEMKQQLDQEAVAKDQKLEAQLLARNALGSGGTGSREARLWGQSLKYEGQTVYSRTVR